jgi:hypothetical protein
VGAVQHLRRQAWLTATRDGSVCATSSVAKTSLVLANR